MSDKINIRDLIGLLVLLLVILSGVYLLIIRPYKVDSLSNNTPAPLITPTITAPSPTATIPADWRTYSDANISFNYPKDWTVKVIDTKFESKGELYPIHKVRLLSPEAVAWNKSNPCGKDFGGECVQSWDYNLSFVYSDADWAYLDGKTVEEYANSKNQLQKGAIRASFDGHSSWTYWNADVLNETRGIVVEQYNGITEIIAQYVAPMSDPNLISQIIQSAKIITYNYL
jgi:hypothetical protein